MNTRMLSSTPGRTSPVLYEKCPHRIRASFAHALAKAPEPPKAAALIEWLGLAFERVIQCQGQVIGATLAQRRGNIEHRMVDDGRFPLSSRPRA
jgi:hypothetical protein